MKQILVCMVSLLTMSLSAQTTAEKFKKTYKNTNPSNEHLGSAWIEDPDTSGTNIRYTPSGKVMNVINPNDDSGLMVVILESWNGWFRIGKNIESIDGEDILLKEDSGWIHGSLLRAATSNYGNQKISFYSEPSEKSKIVFTVNTEVFVTFVEIRKDGWTKVKYVSPTGKVYVGWTKGWLCSNPVTNCS